LEIVYQAIIYYYHFFEQNINFTLYILHQHLLNKMSQSPTVTSKRKRMHESYNLDERLHEQFNWDEDSLDNKKIKLDTLNDRKEVFNKRASFTNLVSSASLILPPEVDTVVITKDKFVVEWVQNPDTTDTIDTITKIPPTQVKQLLHEDDRSELGKEIHQNSFRIPVYYCNSFTPNNIIKKINEERRMIINSQINDAETSLSPAQIESYSETTKKSLIKKATSSSKDRSVNEKLSKSIRAINESLEYFSYLPPKDVPVRDKKIVSILLLFFISKQNK
jgi:hypothetical protein